MNKAKVVFIEKGTKIDLADEKQMKELFKNAIEVDKDAKHEYKIKDGKVGCQTTFKCVFESPEKLFNEGRHPNQAIMEQIFGKPKT